MSSNNAKWVSTALDESRLRLASLRIPRWKVAEDSRFQYGDEIAFRISLSILLSENEISCVNRILLTLATQSFSWVWHLWQVLHLILRAENTKVLLTDILIKNGILWLDTAGIPRHYSWTSPESWVDTTAYLSFRIVQKSLCHIATHQKRFATSFHCSNWSSVWVWARSPRILCRVHAYGKEAHQKSKW